MQLTCTASRVLGQQAAARRSGPHQRRVTAAAEPQKAPAGVNRWADFSLGHPNSANRGIDVTGLPTPPPAPKPAAPPAPAAPAASAAVAAEPAPVPYAQRKASPQAAPLGTLAKMPAAPAKPTAPAAAAPASQPVCTSSPAAAKWDHATRVMPAGSAAPVTPKMDPAAFNQAASKPAAPSPPPAGVNRWADWSLANSNPNQRGIDVTGLPSSPAPAAPTPAPVAAAAAPVPASAPVAAEPAPVPYAQRKASPQAAPLGTLAKMPAAPAKPATPAAAAPAKPAAPAAAAPASQPVRSSSPAAAKWDHATRVMPAGSAAPVTPKMDPAAFSQEASKPAAPSPPPAGVNRWADFSLGHPNSSKRGIDVTF